MDCENADCCPDDCNPSDPPLFLKPVPDWVAQVQATRSTNEAFNGCALLCFTVLLMIMCIVSYMFCKPCLFGILVFSACLCPFFHPLNAPLWLAILLLTIGGWSFTAGALEVRWKSQR